MAFPPGYDRFMQHWLGAEWPAFADALAEPPTRAVRLHRVAVPKETAQPDSRREAARLDTVPERDTLLATDIPPLAAPPRLVHALGDPVPWSRDGFYIRLDSPLGRDIMHEAGAYYIQEPSAMAVVEALDPRPGERILDLCAAPGGKATAIGRRLGSAGTLVANEVHPERARILLQNIERTGALALVVSEHPQRLAELWPGQFDAVLVDAPCSGEGMFRKDPASRQEWSTAAVERCAARQREILRHAVRMVKPGGRLVYSTCTFNPVENEQVVAWLLNACDAEVLTLADWPGWETGRPEWAGGQPAVAGARRLWPHTGCGEGHFVCALRIRSSARPSGRGRTWPHVLRPASPPGGWERWLRDMLAVDPPEAWLRPWLVGDRLFLPAPGALQLALGGLHVLSAGICLARHASGRFEPHHQLAMALAPGVSKRSRCLADAEALSYLQGLPLSACAQAGYHWLHIGGVPLGWGKSVADRTNNLYPKGLRRTSLVVCEPDVPPPTPSAGTGECLQAGTCTDPADGRRESGQPSDIPPHTRE
ncbi:MAG: RsmF rRNA methyltransferase first C-terminal domain-containing protein [Alicyclobacillaceae bacterium]|nr:RsmF rRNA methyltransferase first C-terminal domain-containing protein [Alicyclobacillaceae bacterium]